MQSFPLDVRAKGISEGKLGHPERRGHNEGPVWHYVAQRVSQTNTKTERITYIPCFDETDLPCLLEHAEFPDTWADPEQRDIPSARSEIS
jgi:hypothetical protein